MTSFFTSPDSLLNRVGARFPPSIWATKALAGGFSASGLLNLALFAGASLLLFAAILLLAEKLFYRGLVGLAEVSGRRRLLSRAQMSQRISSGRNPVRAIFAREWRIMNRTPDLPPQRDPRHRHPPGPLRPDGQVGLGEGRRGRHRSRS